MTNREIRAWYEGHQAGLKPEDVYERIIAGAATTNREVDNLLRVKPKTEPPL
jgi:hypothetical protein